MLEDLSKEELFNKSKEFLDKGNYEEALAYINEAIKKDEMDTSLLDMKGFILLNLDQFDLALELFNETIELGSAKGETYLGKGIAIDYLENPNKAYECFEMAIKLFNSEVLSAKNKDEIYFYLGLIYSYNYNISKANKDFEMDTESESLDPLPYALYRGYSYGEKDDFEYAIEYFDSAIRINPHHFKAYLKRAFLFYKKDMFDKAIRDCNYVISNDKNNPVAYNVRGLTFLGKKNYYSAIKDFNKAILLNHDFPKAYTNRGNLYYEMENLDKAIKDYTEAIKIEKIYRNQSYVPYVNRGNAYLRKGNYDNAIEDYNKALALDENASSVYINMGYCYLLNKKYEDAIKNFTKAIKLEMNIYPKALLYRGRSYYELYELNRLEKNNLTKALDDFDEVIRLTPNNTSAFIYKSKVLVSKGDKKEAKDIIEQVIYNKSISDNQFIEIILIYESLKDLKNIVKTLNYAIEKINSENTLRDILRVIGNIMEKQENNILIQKSKHKDEISKLKQKNRELENNNIKLLEDIHIQEILDSHSGKIDMILEQQLKTNELIRKTQITINNIKKSTDSTEIKINKLYEQTNQIAESLKERQPKEFENKKRELRKMLQI